MTADAALDVRAFVQAEPPNLALIADRLVVHGPAAVAGTLRVSRVIQPEPFALEGSSAVVLKVIGGPLTGEFTSVDAQRLPRFMRFGVQHDYVAGEVRLVVEPVPPACRADLNADGTVNTPDLTFFLGRFGQTATPGSLAALVDFNSSGTVDTADLIFFLGRFGSVCQ